MNIISKNFAKVSTTSLGKIAIENQVYQPENFDKK